MFSSIIKGFTHLASVLILLRFSQKYSSFHNRRHRCFGLSQVGVYADDTRLLFAAGPDPKFVYFLLDGIPSMLAERLQQPGDASDEVSIQRVAESIPFERADILTCSLSGIGGQQDRPPRSRADPP